MAQDDDGQWLSVSAAARRLGISRQALQQRIRRGSVDCRRNNRGDPQIFVSNASALACVATPEADGASVAASMQQAAPEPAGQLSLNDVRELLGEQSERMERQHAAALATLERAHRESTQLLVERVDAAEVRAEVVSEQLSALLDRLSRPWWSRWFGTSKRSNLR